LTKYLFIKNNASESRESDRKFKAHGNRMKKMKDTTLNMESSSPKKRNKREENREKSKELILRASLELFSMKGYGSTTMEMIADRAGISRGLPYLYFESKERLLFFILKRHFDREKHFLASVPKDFNTIEEFIETILTKMDTPFAKGLDGDESLEMRLIMSMMLLPETKSIIQDWIVKFQSEIMEDFFSRVEGRFATLGIEDLSGEMQYLRMVFFGLTFSRLCFGDDFNAKSLRDRIKSHYVSQLAKCPGKIQNIKRSIDID